MQVRAKFIVEERVMMADGGDRVKLRPVHGGSPENAQFFNYTPGGNIDLQVMNRRAAESFVPGKEMYVDFTPVGAQETAETA